MVVMGSIVSLSFTQLNELSVEQEISYARTAVQDLANAADDVYSQGVGAKKLVYIRIPENFDSDASGIENRIIKISAFNNDIWKETKASLVGSLPDSSGGHWLWVEAKKGYVSINSTALSFDKSSIYISLSQGSSGQSTFTITNEGDENALVSLAENWEHNKVSLVLSEYSFQLDSGESREISVNFTSDADAGGNYAGSILVGASFTGFDENISLPVNAEVIVSGEKELIVLPSSWIIEIPQGNSETSSFEICNTLKSSQSNITFIPSSGDAGDWINSVPAISSLSAEKCQSQNISISVPSGTAEGTYYGTITASSDEGYSDSISLEITVSALQETTITRWATTSLKGNNITGEPDNSYDSTTNQYFAGSDFDVTGLSGTITTVRIIWSHEIPASLSNDSLELSYGFASYNDIIAVTYNSGNTPVDKMGLTSEEWEYYDATSNRPGGGNWEWADFSSLKIGGNYNKIAGPDSEFRLDAVGVEITYSG
jgi:hypothetical protein